MTKKDPLDPGLKAILESIRQTVGSSGPAPGSAEETAPAAPPSARAPDTPPDGRTVEEFFADLIRPQVAAWLDANLPEIVQKLAAEEIRRLTGQG